MGVDKGGGSPLTTDMDMVMLSVMEEEVEVLHDK